MMAVEIKSIDINNLYLKQISKWKNEMLDLEHELEIFFPSMHLLDNIWFKLIGEKNVCGTYA